MKKSLIVLTLGCSVAIGYSQGQLNFNNFVAAGTPYAAPIYGPEPGAPGVALQGQGAANLSNPMGSTVYHGTPLAGTGFTAQLWAGPSAAALSAPDQGTGTRSFSTVAALAGYLSSGVTAQYASIAVGATAQTLQVRAWDNRGGTITSWAQVMADQTIPHGLSTTFASPASGFTTAPATPPVTPGMTSFNLFAVPEPSLIALGALGLGALLLRRRK
jgi:hypothetical protein